MNALPEGWSYSRIGELATKIGSGATPRGGEKSYKASGIPLVRSMNIHFDGMREKGLAFIDENQAQKLNNATVAKNDVLLNITGASIGRVTVATEKYEGSRVNQHVSIIRLNDAADPRFLSKFLASPESQQIIIDENYGVTRQALTKGMIEEFCVPLPPLSEQRRIVRKLDTLSVRTTTARAHLTAITKLVEKFKRGIYDYHFANAGGRVPLGSLASVGTGATPKKGKPQYYEGGDVPWITSGAVNKKTILAPSGYITETAIRETNCKLFPAGSLLMAMYGEGKTRGQVARLGIDAATNQALAVIHAIDIEKVDADYLYRFLDSIYLEIRELAEGGVQPNLSLGKIKAFELPLPKLEEQREIVRRIETAFAKIDRLAAEAEKALHLTDRLDQRILAKAFAGELVPQDPNDEPAADLLARIRAQRAAAPKPKRGRKKKAEA